MRLLLCSLLSTLFFTNCGVIFEPDLSKQKVELLSPPDGLNVGTQTQTFVWEELEDADEYQLQIVSEDFDFILDYILDTTLSETSYTLTLEPGIYEWRVIGKNNATETDFDEFSLTISEDTTLFNQEVNIIQPTDNATFETDSIVFLWSLLAYAQNYQLQVATNPSFNSQTLALDVQTANDFYYSVGNLGTDTYYWRIRGLRGQTDSTDYTTTRSFTVDAIPQPVSPADGATINTLPTTLDWTTFPTNQTDTLYIYYENEVNPYRTIPSTVDSYQFTSSDTVAKGAGAYYWTLRARSNTGNTSSGSPLYQFYIN